MTACAPRILFDQYVANSLPEIVRINALIQESASAEGLSADVRFTLELALEELLTNLIKYAYTDKLEHRIGVKLMRDSERLLLCIEDDGLPFDPTQLAEPDTDRPIEQRPIGGLGIHLIKNKAESMRYQRVGGLNKLEVCFKIEQE